MSERAELERRVLAKSIYEAIDGRWPNLGMEGWEEEEALALISKALLSQAQPAPSVFAILYEEAGRYPEIFTGYGAEAAALKTFEDRKLTWNCYLLAEIKASVGEARPDLRTANIPDVRKLWEECQGEAQPPSVTPDPEWWGRPCEDCKEAKIDCQCLLKMAAKVASMATAEYLRRVEIAAIEKRAQPPAHQWVTMACGDGNHLCCKSERCNCACHSKVEAQPPADGLREFSAKLREKAKLSREEAQRIRLTVHVATDAESNCHVRAEVWDDVATELAALAARVPQAVPTDLSFFHIGNLVWQGLQDWKAKGWNAKWWKRIDGTPIPNDLTVCIAERISKELRAAAPPAGEGSQK